MNKNRLRNIVKALTPDETSVDFKLFDDEVEKLKESLREKVQAKTLDDVNTQLERFRKRLDFSPLLKALESTRETIEDKTQKVKILVEQDRRVLERLVADESDATSEKIGLVTDDINRLTSELKRLDGVETDISNIFNRLKTLTDFRDNSVGVLKELREKIKEPKDFTDEIEALRVSLNNRINNLSHGGGNANRNIAIGGNTSVLSTFTDINLKPGSNVTITYAKNQTTKYTDVTIAATGGSGSTRSINSVAVNTAAGDTAGTDYVYLVSGTTTITLPTAVGNTNLYTIKNVGVGTVTVAFTGGETCDGSATLSLPVQYTSVDLISDTTNWNVT